MERFWILQTWLFKASTDVILFKCPVVFVIFEVFILVDYSCFFHSCLGGKKETVNHHGTQLLIQIWIMICVYSFSSL